MRRLLLSSGVALLGLLVAGVPLVAASGQWQGLGPEGARVLALTFQPGNPQVVYAAAPGAVFKSGDGGASWSWSGAGLDPRSNVYAVAIDAVHPSTLYAAGGGLFRSLNGGQSWRYGGLDTAYDVAAHPRAAGTVFAASERGLFRSLDSGATWKLLTRRRPRGVRATLIRFDPTSARRLFASFEDPDSGAGGLFASLDGGVTWRPIHGGPLNNQRVFALAVAARSPQTLYAGTSTGVFKSVDAGATWGRTGLEGAGFVWSLAAHPLRRDVVYAGTTAGIFRSVDGGITWTRLAAGLPAPPPDAVYALAFHPSARLLLAGIGTTMERAGVFRSTDDGESWTFAGRGLFGLVISSVAVDPADPEVLWTIGNSVPFKSVDRGRTWVRVRSAPGAGDFRATRVAVDPADPSTVYLLLASGGLLRTHDGGATWEAAGDPEVAPTGNAALVIDPRTPTTLYAAGLGIAKSTDGGTTWTHLSGDPADMVFFDLEISPSQPSTLYGAGGGGSAGPRVVRSTDGGATWTRIQQGLPGQAFDVAVDPQVSTTLYALVDMILYRTTDGGGTWSLFSNAFRFESLRTLGASPSTPGLVYAPVAFGNVFQNLSDTGVWEPLGQTPFGAFYSILLEDPRDPCRLYAGTYNVGLLVFQRDGC